MPFAFAEVPMKTFLDFVWDMVLDFAMQFAAVAAIAVVLCGLWLTVTSGRLKTGTKTFVVLTISEGLACFVGWLSWQSYRADNLFGAVVGGIVAAAMALGFLIFAVCGHKRDWKQE